MANNQFLFLSQYNSYGFEQMHKKAVSWYSLHLHDDSDSDI